MKSFHALLLFFFLFTIALSAQIETFDISQYFLPEVNLKQLDFSASLGGNNQSTSSTLNLGTYSRLANTLGLGYHHFISTPAQQKEANFIISNNFSFRNTASIMGLASEDAIYNRTEAYIFHTKRFYLQPKRFIGLAYDIDVNNAFNSAINNGGIRSIENELQLELSATIQYGFGRIEPVTNAWHAVRILQDFESLGILSRTPTQHEIRALAKVLSNLTYDRIFDQRLAKIRHIQILDEHIAAVGLVDKFDGVYFTSLYDMYQFGVQRDRYSGERFSFGPEIQSNTSSRTNNDNLRSISTYYSIPLLLQYDFNNPLNQKWQLDILANLRAGFEGEKINSFAYFIKPEFSLSIGYYPSSRTSFEAQFRIQAKFINKSVFTGTSNRSQYYSTLRGVFNYYLSPRTRLEANLSYQYAHNSYFASTLGGIPPIASFNINDGFSLNYGISVKQAIY